MFLGKILQKQEAVIIDISYSRLTASLPSN
jgi:hypothetical protein